ncbi:hypothetical protein LIA77_03501 [Sarocladium implicatum]|nr:hypothetical protein LIA77_03501 [Sarocladium implicatum]
MTIFESLFHTNGIFAQLRVLIDMATAGPPASNGKPPGMLPFTTQSPSLTTTRRRKRICRPVEGSLYDVMHEHAGTSLFLRPICWSDTHAELLGAQFEQLPPCDTPVPSSLPGSPPSKGHMRPSPTITSLSNALTEILAPNHLHSILSSTAVRSVLSTLWPETFCKPRLMPEWDLHFGERVYRDAVRAPVMWNFPTEAARSLSSSFRTISTQSCDSRDLLGGSNLAGHNPVGLPMLCYIGRSHLAAIRKNLFRVAPGPDKTPNVPVLRLQQARAKKLIPANLDHDAHFVGIFLAMAQRHFYGAPLSRKTSPRIQIRSHPKKPHFQDLKLRILTHDSDTADFIVYTAYITAGFLEWFHDPANVPASFANEECAGMRIEYSRVPIWPILGLRERLGKALGHDLVGVINEDSIETWQTVEEGSPQVPPSGKRKRDALSEVVNSSFEDECEKEPSLDGKRRCLREGPPLGIVI